MSKTDKTQPIWVRKSEFPIQHDHHLGYCQVEKLEPWRETRRREYWTDTCNYFYRDHEMKWTNAERGIGPKQAKWAKRMKAKKNRRRKVPYTQIRGHGWGEENYRINW